jgi:lysophospholipase L1-like esterase
MRQVTHKKRSYFLLLLITVFIFMPVFGCEFIPGDDHYDFFGGYEPTTDNGDDTNNSNDVSGENLTVYIAGDSTVCTYTDTAGTSDQAGWGQMLHEYYDDRVTVNNHAIGGRTALWFALEGGVDSILSTIEPGDYFLIQFGTNDSHTTATFTINGTTYQRYADPDTDFKDHLLQYYITPIQQAGAIPVLVTPPPRNSAYCTGGNSLSRWAQAMRELGAANNVTVVDLNQKTVDHLIGICPSPTPEDFFMLRADGTVDGTHFQENGARILAGFVAEGIAEAGLGLADYEK